jgi:hypothetical protein
MRVVNDSQLCRQVSRGSPRPRALHPDGELGTVVATMTAIRPATNIASTSVYPSTRPIDDVRLVLRGPFRSWRRDRYERFELEEVLLADAPHVHQLLDLLAEDNRLNVHAGELEVRPPGAPTTRGL